MITRIRVRSTGRALAGALLALSLLAHSARAEDTLSTRVDAGLSAGPKLFAWDFGYGVSFDAYVDGFVLRLGGVLGVLGYPKDGWPAFVTATPEASVHFGKEDDQRWYFTAQVPLRVMTVQAPCASAACRDRFLGVRGGVELEQRDRELGVRGRIGLFVGALQRDDGKQGVAVSLRVILELGRPVVPKPPPLPCDRMCPDGKTPLNPLLPCPPTPPEAVMCPAPSP